MTFFEIFALICYHFSRCLFNICLQRCMKLQQVLQLGDAAVAAGDTLLAPMNKVGHSLGRRSPGAAKLQASGRGARPPAWGAAAAEAALPSGLSSRPVPPGRTRVQAQALGRCRGRSWLGGPPWVRPGPGRWGEERTKVRAALCRPLGCRRDRVGGGGRENNTFPVSRKPGAMAWAWRAHQHSVYYLPACGVPGNSCDAEGAHENPGRGATEFLRKHRRKVKCLPPGP